MSHPFGDLLSQYRARKHGLSQARLAAAIGYTPTIVTKMCAGGKELTGPSGRDRVVRIVGALRDFGALTTLDEANALLAAADMPPLFERQPAEAKLLAQLHQAQAPHTQPPALDGRGVRKTNLLAQLTSFIGREQEMAALIERVQTTRLLTLIGSGGVGKTRLAIEVGSRFVVVTDSVASAWRDGVWLVAFAPLSDPAHVPQTVANTFKLPEQPSRAHLDALIAYLEAKHWPEFR